MLKIRREQMAAFEEISLQDFENRTLDHIREVFPKHFQILGEERIRGIIRYGLEKARGYRVTKERSVRFYTDLIFMLGFHFDEDPQIPWAAEILKDKTKRDQSVMVDHLYTKAKHYFDHVAGQGGQHMDKALRRIAEENIERWALGSSREIEKEALEELKRLFPEKAQYVGEEGMRELIKRGIASALEYGITTDRGIILFIGLMYILGIGFDRDPQFPWISAVLEDQSIKGEDERVQRLHRQTMDYLDKWLALKVETSQPQ